MGDDVSNIIKESIDQVLQYQQYVPVKVRAAALFPFPPPRTHEPGADRGHPRRRRPAPPARGATQVNSWCSLTVEHCLKRLTALNKPFKYIVTCVIMQKNGAGLHTSSSCYWDNSTDGSRTVRWENKSMYCIATVFGVAI